MFLFILFALGLDDKILHELSGIVTSDIVGVIHKLLVEGDGSFDSFDDKFVQGALHLSDSLLSGLRCYDELGGMVYPA